MATQELLTPVRLRESQGNKEIVLSPSWTSALNNVGSMCEELNLKYAVIGSFGNEITRLEVEQDTHEIGGTHAFNFASSDLDVLILNDYQTTNLVKEKIKMENESGVKIDILSDGDHSNIVFDNGKVKLSYREIFMDLDPSLFKLYEFNLFGNAAVPVLHPKTYFHMLLEANPVIRPKIKQRLIELKKINSISTQVFPDIPDELFQPFEVFTEAVRKKYPSYSQLRTVRKLVSKWRDEGRYKQITGGVDFLKRTFSNEWESTRSRLTEHK